MKEKKTNCKYCNSEMQPKTTRQEFCSAKCRVYWNREHPKPKDAQKSNTASNKTQYGDKKQNPTNPSKNVVNAANSLKNDRPIRMEGESGLDYGIRVNEWKQSLLK